MAIGAVAAVGTVYAIGAVAAVGTVCADDVVATVGNVCVGAFSVTGVPGSERNIVVVRRVSVRVGNTSVGCIS